MRSTPLALALAALVAVTSTPQADAQTRKASTARKAPAKKPASKSTPAKAECTDFYDAINRDWLAAHPAPAGNAVTSALAELQARSVQQQRDLLDAAMASPQNNVQKLLGDFWASGLDEAAVEADGSRPLVPLLARIDGIKRTGDVAPSIAALHQVGIPVGFNFSADVDLDDLNRHIGYFTQGGLGLGDPAFYTRQDVDVAAIMSRYRKYVQNILTLTGTKPDKLQQDTDMVLGVESRIAAFSKPMQPVRDPRTQFNPVAVNTLAAYRNLQLDAFLKAQAVNDDRVSMIDPAYFTQLDALVKQVPVAQWKTYLRFHVGNAMAPYLSRSFRDAEREFRGVVFRGETAPPPRWMQVLDAVNLAAGPMLGREYAARYVPEATRTRAEGIVGEVGRALIAEVAASPWMSAAAKQEAQAKLSSLRIEVGTPRRDLDYTVQPMGRGSFGSNMLIASTWRHAQEMRRIGKGNADRRWDVLPQTPALGYDPAQNRLIVTAAMLQAPVLDMAQSPGAHYGAFGALAGHEMARAIDGQGRMVDSKGVLRDWWTAEDANAWNERLARIGAQSAAFAYPGLPGKTVNPQLTRMQDALDWAGLNAAWAAMVKGQVPVASDASAFFNGWGRMWAQQMGPQAAAIAQATSPHAPGKWRVNGPLSVMPQFAQSFQCKAGEPMVRAMTPVSLWR